MSGNQANTKADISKRTEELTQYCCAAEVIELTAKRNKANRNAKMKIDERLAELEKICGKKKSTSTPGDGAGGGNDKPKVTGGATSKIVQAEDADSIFSDDSILYSNLRSDNNAQLKQYPLGRAQVPGIEIEPTYMLLRAPDELPYSENHALIITAFDETNDTGLIKALEVSAGEVINERPDIELPGARPIDAAYETGLPLAPSNRLYVLDSAKKEVLCIVDTDFDGLPDAQHATFATVGDFPALETTKSLSLFGLGDGGDIALSTDDLRSDDVVSAPADVVVLFDDDGDCVADRSEVVVIQPAPSE